MIKRTKLLKKKIMRKDIISNKPIAIYAYCNYYLKKCLLTKSKKDSREASSLLQHRAEKLK